MDRAWRWFMVHGDGRVTVPVDGYGDPFLTESFDSCASAEDAASCVPEHFKQQMILVSAFRMPKPEPPK